MIKFMDSEWIKL